MKKKEKAQVLVNLLYRNAAESLPPLFYTNNQLKTVQKIEHNLAYMDYAKIFCLQFYWLFVLYYKFSFFCLKASDYMI